MTNFYGDFSNHDWSRGGMDIDAMAADGIEGGFHKLSDGLHFYTDPYFETAITRMHNSAFKFYGAYHVLWGDRDIAGQVDYMLGLLDLECPWWRTDPKFRIMSDNEPFGYNGVPSIAQINQFHDIFKSKVNKPQFAYAPNWVYSGSQSGINYPVVASNYGSNPAVHYPVGYPGDNSSRWRDDSLQFGSQLTQGSQAFTDCNAVRNPAVWATLVTQEKEMPDKYLSKRDDDTIYLSTGIKSRGLTQQALNDIIYMHQKGTPYTLAVGEDTAPVGEWMDYGGVPKVIRLGGSDDRDGPVDQTVTMTDAQVTALAEQIASKITPGASADEIKAIINATNLSVA